MTAGVEAEDIAETTNLNGVVNVSFEDKDHRLLLGFVEFRPMNDDVKRKRLFAVRNAATPAPRWLGRCPECEQWNTFVEEEEMAPARLSGRMRPGASTPFSSDVVTLG